MHDHTYMHMHVVYKPEAATVVKVLLSKGGAHLVHTAWFAGKTTP